MAGQGLPLAFLADLCYHRRTQAASNGLSAAVGRNDGPESVECQTIFWGRVHVRKVVCRHARRAAASCAGCRSPWIGVLWVLAQAVPRESRARQPRGRHLTILTCTLLGYNLHVYSHVWDLYTSPRFDVKWRLESGRSPPPGPTPPTAAIPLTVAIPPPAARLPRPPSRPRLGPDLRV